ncbi:MULTISPECIES: metallopeptidase family protein [unclassified Corynebacterium]|uniref:metallopeptidase family protein n=1 Tax=unclassified Corynebacterium TaxID=2624378 RepID=UPI001EF42F38|nr:MULTISPECIES: metallopeptidase family protein [unclassified Corynebacterium]MCG7258707.1 metallopeptidase family protein [Corynebacterium sp. ACRQK]MCG7263805.1 metallopeptidase family protein [Corynebacterium sp. ACRQL]
MKQDARMRQDPRGRGIRGILLPEVPRNKSRSERFDDAVLDAFEPILERFDAELSSLDVAVDVVPRMRLSTGYRQWPEDVVADGQVPLGRLVTAGVDNTGAPTRPRIIIFRRPVESRAASARELQDILRMIIVRLVACYLNVSPNQIDPRL